MERRAKVELFEQIRREYEFGVDSIKGVARKLGVHRRMVRQALADAQPPERKPSKRERPVMGPLITFIDAILEADRTAPRKQRHTAHRIWQRILAEVPERQSGGSDDSAVCARAQTGAGMVSTRDLRAAELSTGTGRPGRLVRGVGGAEWRAGAAAGVRDAQHGERRSLSSCLSTRDPAGVPRSSRACLPVLSGRISGFCRYDNLKAAVKKILRGFRREETARFIAFRSHWRFESEFCTPYEAHEKGGIEGEAGYFRRNHWVPMPKARDLAELNSQLLAACHAG